MDAYELLGLSKEPTDDDVRRAFRKLARDTHPDHQPASEQAAAELRMQQLNEARRRAMSDLDQRRARRTPPRTATIAPVVPLQRDAAERASMACGTPVIAFPGGAVEEIVKDGISGRVCSNASQAAKAMRRDKFQPRVVRQWVEENFSSRGHGMAILSALCRVAEKTAPDPTLDTEETAA